MWSHGEEPAPLVLLMLEKSTNHGSVDANALSASHSLHHVDLEARRAVAAANYSPRVRESRPETALPYARVVNYAFFASHPRRRRFSRRTIIRTCQDSEMWRPLRVTKLSDGAARQSIRTSSSLSDRVEAGIRTVGRRDRFAAGLVRIRLAARPPERVSKAICLFSHSSEEVLLAFGKQSKLGAAVGSPDLPIEESNKRPRPQPAAP